LFRFKIILIYLLKINSTYLKPQKDYSTVEQIVTKIQEIILAYRYRNTRVFGRMVSGQDTKQSCPHVVVDNNSGD